ncbi:MAG TPA: hypothetical protein VNQ31_09490, partial [Sphingomonadaceae bacterium]|nr:hypothetical protein [Sphingomonadaceae bacterium]
HGELQEADRKDTLSIPQRVDLTSGRFLQNRQIATQQLYRIGVQRVRHFHELDQIEPPFSHFIFRYKRLGTPKPHRQVSLCHLRVLTSGYEQVSEFLLLWRTKRSGHKVRQLMKPALPLIPFSDYPIMGFSW